MEDWLAKGTQGPCIVLSFSPGGPLAAVKDLVVPGQGLRELVAQRQRRRGSGGCMGQVGIAGQDARNPCLGGEQRWAPPHRGCHLRDHSGGQEGSWCVYSCTRVSSLSAKVFAQIKDLPVKQGIGQHPNVVQVPPGQR